jgi:hypothetical protein
MTTGTLRWRRHWTIFRLTPEGCFPLFSASGVGLMVALAL